MPNEEQYDDTTQTRIDAIWSRLERGETPLRFRVYAQDMHDPYQIFADLRFLLELVSFPELTDHHKLAAFRLIDSENYKRQRDEARAKVTRLRSAAEKFARHFDWCAFVGHADPATLPPKCNCGYAREFGIDESDLPDVTPNHSAA